MTITVHQGDLPSGLDLGASVAVDTETMGLNLKHNRLCLVQISGGDGNAHLVQIGKDQHQAPNLKKLMEDKKVLKIFHYARFDIAMLKIWLAIDTSPIYCTKTASRLVRTFTDKHSLKYLAKDLLDVDLSKQEQSSDWGADILSDRQKEYAASDVLHLHKIRAVLDEMLIREGRMGLAQACFDFLPTRAALDIAGWNDFDIFAH